MRAARIYDAAHAQFLSGRSSSSDFRAALLALEARFPGYAPGRFLKGEYLAVKHAEPRFVASEVFALRTPDGGLRSVEISAVQVRVGDSRGVVIFVDNAVREVYGQRYQDGSTEDLDVELPAFAGEVLAALRDAYEKEAAAYASRGLALPPDERTLDHLRAVVASKTGGGV